MDLNAAATEQIVRSLSFSVMWIALHPIHNVWVSRSYLGGTLGTKGLLMIRPASTPYSSSMASTTDSLGVLSPDSKSPRLRAESPSRSAASWLLKPTRRRAFSSASPVGTCLDRTSLIAHPSAARRQK